ncbi:unnamed protein product [Mytilus edulis]|uniref:Uncharacterized protein n=1 Tax=Mytilus edulis TaxID=6550 RepID=A0A8S3VF43_MYTED|nr:unnamed protein product [Mytilus edulis]
MLEMRALGCKECLFVCWSEESSTVFRVRIKQRLIALILNETMDVYYGDNKTAPSRLSVRTKEMKVLCKEVSEQSEFIGEFPSVYGTVTIENSKPSAGPYVVGDEKRADEDTRVDDLLQALLLSLKARKEVYQLSRKKASEIIPILISTLDRTFNAETGHAVPIGYFLRGYSLSTETMRKIADDFMQLCHQNGLHVPVQTFDGQWMNLVTRDCNGNPLTKLQLQKRCLERG